MWGAYRWAARFLLLVMLASSLGPMAMACALQPEAMHCMRHPVSAHAAQSAMHCHYAMAQLEASRPDASFQATSDDCCKTHCCCGATTSEWGQPASHQLSFLNLLIELAHPAQSAVVHSSDISGLDSARAPPRS
jgi:hypothetical protein